uniref:Protein krueppel n=1 Tax=Heliothis virescens TaxID=7102 RepID=A0A2A4JG74_HELVI
MSGSYFMLKFLKKARLKKQRKLLTEDSNSQATNLRTINVSNNKCRICLKDANQMIFNPKSPFNIKETIILFCGIHIDENDNNSKYLCKECYTFLEKAVAFRKLAQETQKLSQQKSSEDSAEKLDSSPDADDSESDTDEVTQKAYSCKLCKLYFKTFDELIIHKKSKTHKNVRIQCPMCHRLLTAQLYQKHLARHKSASHLVCDICGKLYRKDNLVRHLQLHSYDLPFRCQICPYRGRFMESLKIHMRTHTGHKPFSCDKCELRFLTRSNLNRHLLTHKKERPFKCLECGRGFYIKSDMDVHFKSDHAGLKEFGCRMCGNKYGTRKALMRHELRVHKRDKMAKGRMPLYLRAEYQKQDEVT